MLHAILPLTTGLYAFQRFHQIKWIGRLCKFWDLAYYVLYGFEVCCPLPGRCPKQIFPVLAHAKIGTGTQSTNSTY
jgi:hypothetical protein